MTEEELNNLYYPGNDLGAIYTLTSTYFALWAPTAKEVFIRVSIDGSFQEFSMIRDEYYVYRIQILGNLLNAAYYYVIKHEDDTVVETLDPYGRGVTLNSEYSAVVDIKKVAKSYNAKVKKHLKAKVDSVIYEVGVRDFTEDKHSNILHKGKFSGFVEKGRKTNGGNKAGLDYLVDLGITHVQLNPVMDFANVDDVKLDTYNWGYDVTSYFALEGSLSENPEVPMARLLEFKKMIYTLHKNNIRVILDVVYNHIFAYEKSALEKVVPGFYFRKRGDGTIANGSGCGNELATDKRMVSKLILDSIKYFLYVFDVDGFRFDLMGLIDIETMNKIARAVYSHKKDALLYGEGWNMGESLPFENRACSENYAKIDEEIGFFQDHFRDQMNGNVFDINNIGYIMGDTSYSQGVVDSMMKIRFGDSNRCINYIECHDNSTIYDRFSVHYSEGDSDILRRVNLANALTICSVGIPFIHMGQEIGQSKQGLNNTYNVKKVNNFSYALLDQRIDMVEYFKDFILFRKELRNFYIHNKENVDYDEMTEITPEGLLIISIVNKKPIYENLKELKVIINPTNKRITHQLDDYYFTILDAAGVVFDQKIKTSTSLISPISFNVIGRK